MNAKTRILVVSAMIACSLAAASPSYAERGEYCREYTTRLSIGGDGRSGYGTACMKPDGSWEIVKLREPDFDSKPIRFDVPRSSDVVYVRDQQGRLVYVMHRNEGRDRFVPPGHHRPHCKSKNDRKHGHSRRHGGDRDDDDRDGRHWRW